MNETKLVDRHRKTRPRSPAEVPLPPQFLPDGASPEDYVMDQALEDAANAALQLGQPLLLVGDPGTGKTQFAHHLAWQLGLLPPLEFHTKSSSVAGDLFYSHDTVRRFHAAHTGGGKMGVKEYLHFNALGKAMLLSRPAQENLAFCRESDNGLLGGPLRSVVLVDEIDKASRDFPNDLLHELAAMDFRIAELGETVQAAGGFRPVVVVTSNRERPLPDAFLRRCVFHLIKAPDEERLMAIFQRRFGLDDGPPSPLLKTSVEFCVKAGEGGTLERPLSTSEMVGWFRLLISSGARLDQTLGQARAVALGAVAVLAKNEEDQSALSEMLKRTA